MREDPLLNSDYEEEGMSQPLVIVAGNISQIVIFLTQYAAGDHYYEDYDN